MVNNEINSQNYAKKPKLKCTLFCHHVNTVKSVVD